MFNVYIDDTTIVSTHHNVDILYSQENTEVRKWYNWFCHNKLSLSIDKTNYMLF